MVVLETVRAISYSPFFYVPLFLSAAFGVCILFLQQRPPIPRTAPKLVKEGYPVLGATRFFTARWDFFRDAIRRSPTGQFSFYIGKHHVVGLSGDLGRKVFFDSKQLGFNEGYAVMFGQSPKVRAEDEAGQDLFNSANNFFVQRLMRLTRKENFVRGLPTLMADTRARLNAVAADPSGVTNPFTSTYEIVFQLTMRTVGCNEIADDRPLLDKCLHLFEMIDRSSTPLSVTLPWLPQPAIIKRTYAGGRLYMIVKRIVDERKRSGRRDDDALQFLIDQGDGIDAMIAFIVGALFAGLLNSGINAAWVLCYLADSPKNQAKARAEVVAAAAKSPASPELPLIDRLAALPLEAWESDFPFMDLCLRDSIRLQALGSGFRRNISGRDVVVGDEVIPNGAFVAYHLADLHMDPEVYPDPEKWDPDRYLPERAEDRKKKPHGYVGWGAGRHPCAGMRFAKLEQNIIIAFFLAMFDYELSDAQGNPALLPKVDINGHSAMKPNTPIFLKYRLREKA